MAKPEHSKPAPDGARGVFLVAFSVVVFGIFLLCWLMIRNTELADRLFGVRRTEPAEQSTSAQRPATPSSDTKKEETGIHGRVTLIGLPPEEKVIEPLATDLDCQKYYHQAVKTRFYRVSSDGGLADVYIYVKDYKKAPVPQLKNTVSVDCFQCFFQPYVFAMQKSQALRIVNRDKTFHHLSGVESKDGVPLRHDGVYETSFSKPEIFRRIRCDVHPWEFTYACISDHPYFAVSDADGRFKFPMSLPPGRYTVAAVHRKFGEITQQVEVKGAEAPPWLDFIFKPSNELLAKLSKEPPDWNSSKSKNAPMDAAGVPQGYTLVPKESFAERNRSDLTGAPADAVENPFVSDPDLGFIVGIVRLNGVPPPNPSVDALLKDPSCGKFHAEAPQMKFYAVGTNNGLADTFVCLVRTTNSPVWGSFAPPPDSVVLDQKACEFFPYVTGLQVGQKLVVKNSDPVMHNVHFMPAVSGNKESNKAQMPNSNPFVYQFQQSEPFLKLKCDVHSWMFSYICVVDHPYFAVTGTNGTFRIRDVPPGAYELIATHRKAGSVRKQITVARTSKPTTAVFSLEAR